MVISDDWGEDWASDESQIKEMTLIGQSVGLKQLIVAYNNQGQDEETATEATTRLSVIEKSIFPYLKKIGFTPKNVIYVPVNSDIGHNLVPKLLSKLNLGPNIFGGFKKCFMDALDGLRIPKILSQKPLRLPLDAIYRLRGRRSVMW